MTLSTSLPTTEPSFAGRKYIIEFVLFGVYMVFGAAWAASGSMMPEIMADLHLNISQASFMSNIITVAKIFGALLTGILVYRIGFRWSYLLGCMLISAGVFVNAVESYSGILAIRFLTGLGSAICLVCLAPVVQQYFSPKARPIVNGINATSNIWGTVFALLFAVSLSRMLGGWRESLAFFAWINLIFASLWFIFFKESRQEQNTPSLSVAERRQEFKEVLLNRVTWGMIIVYIGPICFLITSFTYLPTYYREYAGLAKDSSAFLSPTLTNLAMIFGPFIGMWLKRRGFLYKKVFLYTGLGMLLTALTMLFAKQSTIIILAAIATGLLLSTWFPYLFTLPSEMKNANPTRSGYIMSTFWCLTFTLSTTNIWLIGYFTDLTGSFTLGFSYMLGLIALFVPLAYMIFPTVTKPQAQS